MKLNCSILFVALAGATFGLPTALAAPASPVYLKASNSGRLDQFGLAVAISGDTMVVGAPSESSNATGVNGNQNNNNAPGSGAVYVFVRSGATWVQQAYLKASNTGGGLPGSSFGDAFGYSVAVFGDTIVVGAPAEDSNATGVNGNPDDNSALDSGAAYVFVRNGNVWSQQAYLKPSNTSGPLPGELYGDQFGWSVAVSGDTVVVGAYTEDSNATGVNGDRSNNAAPDSGAAYVFVRTGSTWSQQAYLKASNTGAGDWFGISVAVAGDTVVVGAQGEDDRALDSGAAYVFVRTGATWSQQAYLKAANAGAHDSFGTSVAVSGDTVVVGAWLEDSNGTGVNGQDNNEAPDSGAAYVFVRSGTIWSQQACLKAFNSETYDYFGWSVSVSGDFVVVGAPGEASRATGVNGDEGDNTAPGSGAAYVFHRSGTTWCPHAYLKASNTGRGDQFGSWVAMSGDTVVVGANYEASSATGVDGNQSDNSATASGAAYIFPGANLGPQLTIVRDSGSGYWIRFRGVPGCTYQLQRAAKVGIPWTTIATLTAPPSGLVEYQDVSGPTRQSFYRTVQP